MALLYHIISMVYYLNMIFISYVLKLSNYFFFWIVLAHIISKNFMIFKKIGSKCNLFLFKKGSKFSVINFKV